ncbi:paramyosin, short form-like [Anoplophora glabripennis]|uniref:paramyosin, short form-like n=1 Tax=Anoplophora glabripennis TaxID=217634 RepID=UPI00087457E1|nr:paramyosin, short form-like [Anoplophora glabripennis]
MSRAATTTKWRPTTATYDYNYGVGINFYQPMVDFIEEKDSGRKRGLPHLPWTDELGLDQYDPMKIKSYSQDDLTRISRKTEASAKERLRDFKSCASSTFVLSKSVSAASITEKVKTETKKQKAIIREIKKLKSKMYDDLRDYNPDKDKEIERQLMASQKYLRGKSARGIEAQLLSESRKTISEGIEQDKFTQSTLQKCSSSRSLHKHVKIMDKRMQVELEDSFMEPLSNLSTELKCFDRRSTHYFIDQR